MNIRRTASRFSVVLLAVASVTAGCGGSASNPAKNTTTGTTTTSASGSNTAASSAGGGGGSAPTTGDGGGGGTAPTTGGGDAGGGGAAPNTPAHSQHKRCAWIGADNWDAGKASFLANPNFFDAIHPTWFYLNADGATLQQSTLADDADIMAAAHANGVKVIPLVGGVSADNIRAAMATPATIAAHAALLATLVTAHGYDGIEMDYEGLWAATDQAQYSALVSAVATALHAVGKVVTLAVPAMDTAVAASGYNYAALGAAADVVHLMGYDYHYLGGDHLGPIAPKGWIAGVISYVASLGVANKFSLGIANYGVGSGWYTDAGTAMSLCQPGTFSETTDHMDVCPYGHPDAGVAPHCTTAQGDIWFEDANSVAEKAALAKASGIGGIAYYTLGGEPAGYQAAIASAGY